jgi:hypothetical protein
MYIFSAAAVMGFVSVIQVVARMCEVLPVLLIGQCAAPWHVLHLIARQENFRAASTRHLNLDAPHIVPFAGN